MKISEIIEQKIAEGACSPLLIYNSDYFNLNSGNTPEALDKIFSKLGWDDFEYLGKGDEAFVVRPKGENIALRICRGSSQEKSFKVINCKPAETKNAELILKPTKTFHLFGYCKTKQVPNATITVDSHESIAIQLMPFGTPTTKRGKQASRHLARHGYYFKEDKEEQFVEINGTEFVADPGIGIIPDYNFLAQLLYLILLPFSKETYSLEKQWANIPEKYKSDDWPTTEQKRDIEKICDENLQILLKTLGLSQKDYLYIQRVTPANHDLVAPLGFIQGIKVIETFVGRELTDEEIAKINAKIKDSRDPIKQIYNKWDSEKEKFDAMNNFLKDAIGFEKKLEHLPKGYDTVGLTSTSTLNR